MAGYVASQRAASLRIPLLLLTLLLTLLLANTALAAETPEGISLVRIMEESTFSDVERDHWFYSGVKTSYELGMMGGVGGGRFAPGETVPWSQAAAIACRIHAAHQGKTIADGEETWYAPYAAYGKEAGILPEDSPGEDIWETTAIDRQSTAQLLRAALPESTFPAISDRPIPDLEQISDGKREAAALLYAAGIFCGRTDGSFDPAGLLTRGELATILTRLLCPAWRTDPAQAALYRLTPEGPFRRFTNHVDGYSLAVGADLAVDMSYAGVGAALENDRLRLEIYRQDLSQCGWTGYLNYSNGFLKNQVDHHLDHQGYSSISGRQAYITAWHRKKLARAEGDKNHYVTLDILNRGVAYSIFLKSDRADGLMEEALRLAESFRTEPVTAGAYLRTAHQQNTDTRGWDRETAAYYQQLFGEEAELTWGIFEPDAAGLNYKTLTQYEARFDYQFPVLLQYTDFDSVSLEKRLNTAWSKGKVLELTLQTSATEDGSNMMYDILQGEQDEFLRNYARTIRDFGHPVLFRFGNEMNGDWCPYSGYNTSKDPLIYKAAYRYIYEIFSQEGVDNAIWVWNPNGEDLPDFRWNDALMYYPGDQYVDVVGLTAYNTGTYYAQAGEVWSSFSQLYDPLYEEACRLFEQPLMITEFACASMGGDKEAWVEDMFTQIERFPRIKAAIWWDGVDWDAQGNVARSYVMDETEALLDIFRRHLMK